MIRSGFVTGRLKEALQRRRMTAVALANEIGVTGQMVSKFLTGKSIPRTDVLRQIASVTAEPFEFFLKPLAFDYDEGSPSFMRSYAAATKRSRAAAAVLKNRAREVARYADRYVELPPANFPEFRFGDDPASISWRDIETAAERTREYWGLGTGPIANVVRLLEHHGAVVVRLGLGDETLDAFSQWGMPEARPFIILGNEKHSAVRSRFDACHELGHIVLHRHLSRTAVAMPEVHGLVERQANRFAAAFLMPEVGFRRSVFLPTLSTLQELKPIWGASIGAMLMRLSDLELISQWQRKRLWEAYSPWRRAEPLDDQLEVETPQTLRHAFEIMRDECGLSSDQVLGYLAFAPDDICAIGSLPLGFFRDDGPRLRPRQQSTTILEFRSGRKDPT